MARTISLSTLRGDVLTRGGYGSYGNVFSSATLDPVINSGWSELYDLLTELNDDRYVTEASLTTVANQDYVNAPTDFYKLRGLDESAGGSYWPIRRFELKERARYQNSYGCAWSRYRYRLQGEAPVRIVLTPTPSNADTLRLYYLPECPKLEADDDTIPSGNNYEDLVIAVALYHLEARDRQPLGERLNEIDRLKDRIRASANHRDASEPKYLVDLCDEGGLVRRVTAPITGNDATDRSLRRVADELNHVLENPLLDGRQIDGIDLTTSTTKVSHKLGRVPRGWIVVRTNANAVVYEAADPDQRFLPLTASAAVTVSILVY